MGRRSWPVVALLALAALLAGCTGGSGAGASASTTGGSAVVNTTQACPAEQDATASGATTLPKLHFSCLGGGTLDLAKAPGVPTLVNLWGSWCSPCRDELPVLQQFDLAAAGKVRVVGVVSKDGRPQAESFAADAGVTFPSAFDGQGNLMAGVGINVLPYTYFLDADGAVTYTQVGPVGSLDELRQLVATHLGVQL
jgi:cytochrome c biogenesis protein CcmG/thiol:disulfide interchange protein DsbE